MLSILWGSTLPCFAGTPSVVSEDTAASQAQAAPPAVEEKVPAPPAAVKKESEKILINLASRSLALYDKEGKKIRLYPVGVGKVSTPSPVGNFKILDKTMNPIWIDPDDTTHRVAAGTGNPLGQRWMQFYGNYGIHGTNHPESIGHYVSNGCIRMREKDVEDLFKQVHVGTPVEILYNRLVIEKIPDHTIVYYIYPDGYQRQTLDVATVLHWLSGYGIDDFVGEEDIQKKIAAADGQPTYIGKSFGILFQGQELSSKAIMDHDICYLPVFSLSRTLQVPVTWDAAAGVVSSTFGHVSGVLKKDKLYINADDLGTLFPVESGWDGTGNYLLKMEE